MSNFLLNYVTLIFNKIYSSYKIYKNVKSIAGVSCCGLCKSLVSVSYEFVKLKFLNWVHGGMVKKIQGNKYEVSFTIGSKIYKCIVKHSKMPSDILQIIDGNDNDITDQFEPFINFNCEKVTPGILGYENIDCVDSEGDIVKFSKDEVIEL